MRELQRLNYIWVAVGKQEGLRDSPIGRQAGGSLLAFRGRRRSGGILSQRKPAHLGGDGRRDTVGSLVRHDKFRLISAKRWRQSIPILMRKNLTSRQILNSDSFFLQRRDR